MIQIQKFFQLTLLSFLHDGEISFGKQQQVSNGTGLLGSVKSLQMKLQWAAPTKMVGAPL